MSLPADSLPAATDYCNSARTIRPTPPQTASSSNTFILKLIGHTVKKELPVCQDEFPLSILGKKGSPRGPIYKIYKYLFIEFK